MGLSPPRILLAGATGLVGGLVLKRLLADAAFKGTIIAPTRRGLPMQDTRLLAPRDRRGSMKATQSCRLVRSWRNCFARVARTR